MLYSFASSVFTEEEDVGDPTWDSRPPEVFEDYINRIEELQNYIRALGKLFSSQYLIEDLISLVCFKLTLKLIVCTLFRGFSDTNVRSPTFSSWTYGLSQASCCPTS
jgi:hypothetical protein